MNASPGIIARKAGSPRAGSASIDPLGVISVLTVNVNGVDSPRNIFLPYSLLQGTVVIFITVSFNFQHIPESVSCLSLLCTDSLMATTSPLRNSTCG
jgi:hypothetical protein